VIFPEDEVSMTPRPAKGIERLDENDPGKKCADKIGPDRQPGSLPAGCRSEPQSVEQGQETGAPIGKAKGVDWVGLMLWVFVGICFAVFAHGGYLLWAKCPGLWPH
jgi:hypothetical protein